MVNRKHFRKVAYHLFCFLLALFMLYPMLWMFFSSFKSSEAIFTTASSLFPSEWVFSNYPEGWKGFGGISFSNHYGSLVSDIKFGMINSGQVQGARGRKNPRGAFEKAPRTPENFNS